MAANSLEEQKKILGSRLLEARESCEQTLVRTAEQLGVSTNTIKSFESGRAAPSLPQLELLAHLFRVPIETIQSVNKDLPLKPTIKAEKITDFIAIRNGIIAATIKQHRVAQKISIKKLATAVGISSGLLGKFELGASAIPEPILQALCSQLGIAIEDLYSPLTAKTEKAHPVTIGEKNNTALPEELWAFVTNPANLPYLELAKRLSEMDAAKLRAIAEDLLEITY